ncbi:MAG: isochorismatase family cysteine hydrolase [Pseudomonadota bacterium]
MPKLSVKDATKDDRERAVEPDKTALISIDMQNAEWSEEAEAAARAGGPKANKLAYMERIRSVLLPNQTRLQDAARAKGVDVIYTTIEALTLDGRDISLDHKISGLFHPKGSWEAQIIPAVAPKENDILIPKTASGFFNATNVEYVLRNLGVEYLVIYGICTDQCVETTVRDACDRGFLVTLVPDCCAAEEPPRHDRSIDMMDGHYARVRSTDEVIAELTR